MTPVTRSQILQALEFQSTEDILAFGQAAREAVEMTLRARGELTFSPDLEAAISEDVPPPSGQATTDSIPPPSEALPDSFPRVEALRLAGIGTLTDLAAKSDEELLQIKGIGISTVREIRAAQG